jgi:putative molybdopterin biosynthesis protein
MFRETAQPVQPLENPPCLLPAPAKPEGCLEVKKRNVFIDNTPLQEALALWEAALAARSVLHHSGVEVVPVDEALGRLTAGPVFAGRSSPFYNGAAMDGIAVRCRETLGASEARPIRLLEHSQFVYVNTGNSVPEGFEAVIMIEDVQPVEEGVVEIIAPVTPWQHVRTIGEDIVATELIVPEDHIIRPIDLGAMLASDVSAVKVRREPSVLVIPTGSELVQPGEPARAGQIIEFNSRIIAGYLREWGAAPVRSPIVRDDRESLKRAIVEGAARYDLVVLNAGASAGTHDYSADILRELGEVVVHGVNIKPGKPVILAMVQGKPVIGLPGYPVSTVITLRLFVRRLIAALAGRKIEPAGTVQAALSRPLASKMGVEEFVRVKLGRVGDRLMATPVSRGAGAVMSMVRADGILTVPAASEGIGAGETVTLELLRPEEEIENTLVFIGSHDNILDVLANQLHRRHSLIRLSSAHVGSMGGILAIRRGEAHVAGIHLLDEASSEYNIPFIKRFLTDLPLLLINLAYRDQGLLVPKGNPKKIKSFADLPDSNLRFINRQRGAGTRLLADLQFRQLGIEPAQIHGYDREEYTHMNVAAAVASGSADTGLAIRAAAVALGLDFIPVAQERYDLIVPKSFADDDKIIALLEEIRGNDRFREIVRSLGGYDLKNCGQVLYEQ